MTADREKVESTVGADDGVRINPNTDQASERGPAGQAVLADVVTATDDVFVVVEAGPVKRRLMGEELADEVSHVLYRRGEFIPPEHRDLPTVQAEQVDGVWQPAPATKRTPRPRS